jgi:hypothetical protein
MYTGEVEFIEVITSDRSQPPKVEQVQPLVQPQEAALPSDEPACSAGRVPGSIEEFEQHIKDKLGRVNRYPNLNRYTRSLMVFEFEMILSELSSFNEARR